MEVSIVTGTYNRKKHLQNMVNSVRKSVGVGLPYEIVVVDGGSTDGTLDWCKEQKDIVLIEQGKLLGAVKAFNAGAAAATGRYVILANDDITFVDYAILAALSFMQDNPLVGIGCFSQDRGGQSWHVGVMSIIVEGVQTTGPYGQVCIVPRWLGDQVGWWGDYLYTYGGDNELTCNVYELGYKVQPVPCAMIHDNVLPDDELRKANNQKLMKNGKHPDTEAWKAKWTRKGVLGPVVKPNPVNPRVVTRTERFFYLPIYEPGHNIQKTSKKGMREALARQGLVAECDYISMPLEDVLDYSCAFDADVILTQFHSVEQQPLFNALKEQQPNAIYVNWNGDYHPKSLLSREYAAFMSRFDAVGVVTTSVKSLYDSLGVKWFYWQIGYEEPIENTLPAVQAHDVLFMANGYSRDRLELAGKLRALRGVNVGLYGSWPAELKPSGNTLYDFATGKALYQVCKVAIGDSQWPMATGFVSNRLFQAMAAGAFLLHQYFDGMEELLGLKSGKHLVVWVNWEDLQEKLTYYLSHDSERRKIAKAGQRFMLENHSFDRRVMEMLDRIGYKRLHV